MVRMYVCVRAFLCMDARVRASRACVHVCVCVCMSRLCVCMSRVFSPAQVTVVQRQATRFACVSTDTFSFSPWRLATGLLPESDHEPWLTCSFLLCVL